MTLFHSRLVGEIGIFGNFVAEIFFIQTIKQVKYPLSIITVYHRTLPLVTKSNQTVLKYEVRRFYVHQ